jgi:hypothetical protein
MALHHTKYKKNYRDYILSCVEFDYDGEPLTTDKAKIQHIFHRFETEFGWRIKELGKYAAMAEWLQGLALNIDYYNDDIIKRAIELGSLDADADERTKERCIDNYWVFMANMICWFEHEKQ